MSYNDYRNSERIKCDALILGSGIAGSLLAYELAAQGFDVLLATKGELIDSNTSQAQGGLAAVAGVNHLDNVELHYKDTIESGAGLADEDATRWIIESGINLVNRLSDLHVKFDKNGNLFDVVLEGGHSRARVLHSKDASGQTIATALINALRQHDRIRLFENAFALDLLINEGQCIGAQILAGGRLLRITAGYTIIATGGVGQVFSRTTNPAIATGDGIAMAYRAGAKLVDMEFIQFHPTALAAPNAPAKLISEAVRGAGAYLLDNNGQRFVYNFHKDGELATRDVVSRAIYSKMIEQNSQNVWLDMRPIGIKAIQSKFPNIIAACKIWGIDPCLQAIPVAPAAHYFMGGIHVDKYARTSITGLFAVGECACSGLHGANRLASNSLLEGGVMALKLAHFLSNSNTAKVIGKENSLDHAIWLQAPLPLLKQLDKFKNGMFENVGIERTAQTLLSLIEYLPADIEYQLPAERTQVESANIVLLGWLMARCALERRESRGAHWRCDYPLTDDALFRKRLFVSKQGLVWQDVKTQLHTKPVAGHTAVTTNII